MVQERKVKYLGFPVAILFHSRWLCFYANICSCCVLCH